MGAVLVVAAAHALRTGARVWAAVLAIAIVPTALTFAGVVVALLVLVLYIGTRIASRRPDARESLDR